MKMPISGLRILPNIILVFLVLLLLPLNGEATSITILDKNQQEVPVDPTHLTFLNDDSGQLHIADIQALPASTFSPAPHNSAYFGYHADSNWWLRVPLDSQQGGVWYAVMDYPVLGEVDLFIRTTDGTPLARERLEKHRTPTWRIELPPQQRLFVYIKANNGQEMLYLPLKFMQDEALLNYSNKQYMFFMMVFASFWAMAIYNLFLFFSLRNFSYFSLIIVIIAIQLTFLRDSNLFPALSFLNNPYSYFYLAPHIFTMAFAFNYWVEINQNTNTMLDKLLKLLYWISLSFLPILGLIPNNTQWLFSIMLPLMPVLFLLITLTALRGHRLTISTYWAGSCVIIGVFFYSLPRSGFATEWMEPCLYLAHTSTLLGVLLLSINQAERSRLLREEAERARAASQAKDEFLTTMSHELRTPMHAVTGISSMLQTTQLTHEQQDYITKLDTASRHMLSLIDNILDLARLDQEHAFQQQQQVFHLNQLSKDLFHLFDAQAKHKGLRLRFETPTALQLQLWGYPQELRQTLANLLSNAIKYTEQGEICLLIQQTPHQQEIGNIILSFTVTDTGIGIPLNRQHNLFTPFHQVDNSHSRRYKGSGLGLAISKKLVEHMGSRLEFNSAPKQGSQFFFRLSLRKYLTDKTKSTTSTDTKPHSTQDTSKALQGYKVLLVDDDDLNRFLGKKLVSHQGAEVTVAASGQETLELLQQHHFDLVFMDISMPVMDGYETTRCIRSQARYRQLPIIALSAHVVAGEQQRCLAAGMNDYLTKPFTTTELMTTTLRWLT